MVGVVLFALALVHCIVAQDQQLVQQYEKIVNDGIEESKTYQVPTSAEEFRPTSDAITDVDDVDFIIVGAGAAGAIVANRLSEVTKWKILVLEAGTYGNNFTDIPAMSVYLRDSKYNWGFKTTPQRTACQGMVNKQCIAPRGKAVGGTTVINGLRYVRGNKEDFDLWASYGNPGWSYRDVLPYFKKHENATKISNADRPYHGYNGPMHVEYYRPYNIHMRAVIEGNKDLGYAIRDYNGVSQLAASRAQLNSINGVRVSADWAFWQPVKNRRNVKLLTGSYVTKIQINKRNKKATGVIFARNKRFYRVNAKKEVLLCGGVINTPQILMLSGIGPRKHLKSLKIDVIQDLAVGDNLFDHPLFNVNINTNTTETNKTARQYIREYLNGVGQYAVAIGTQGVGYYKSKFAPRNSTCPDIEIYYNAPMPSITFARTYDGYTNETYQAAIEPVNTQRTIRMQSVNLHPRSKGSIRLQSSDPFKYPLTNPNFYDHPDDIKIVYEGVKIILRLAQTPALRKINATVGILNHPACRRFRYPSWAYWECHIKQYTTLGHHLSGSIKMGPNPSNGDVVDHKLKVHGIKNLRVVDSSIMPRISGHTAAPTFMIAEKMSDEIKREYGEL